jgi:glyoxylate reductase
VTLVVSSSALPLDVGPLLGDRIRYRAPAAGRWDRARLREEAGAAAGLVTMLTDRVDDELLAAAPELKVVANFAVGFDNVDVEAATRRKVVVTNTPGVLTEATADFAFTLLLAAARRLVEGDRLVRSGAWEGWEPGQLCGAEVWGRTLGIVGLGRIGQAMARRGRGFGMRVLYAGPRPVPGADEVGARWVPFEELCAAADFVSLHCPLTDATRHLIDARALAAMKPTAVLVNTARGGCVDEAALAAALERGDIAAAGLDVFAKEPQVHPALRGNDRAVLAPHLGSATTTARRRMAEICATAVRSVLEGRRPETIVNPDAWPGGGAR